MDSRTRVRESPSCSKLTVPRVFLPSSLIQLICVSGCCSRILASHSAVWPPIVATQCKRVSSRCRTSSMPSMKSGNSSNCVHWLYAVEIGTPTSIDSSIVLIAEPCAPWLPRRLSAAPATAAPPPSTSIVLRSLWLRFCFRWTRFHACSRFLVIVSSSRRSCLSLARRDAAARKPMRLEARRFAFVPWPIAEISCLRNFLSRESASAKSLLEAARSLTACVLVRPNIPKSFPRGLEELLPRGPGPKPIGSRRVPPIHRPGRQCVRVGVRDPVRARLPRCAHPDRAERDLGHHGGGRRGGWRPQSAARDPFRRDRRLRRRQHLVLDWP